MRLVEGLSEGSFQVLSSEMLGQGHGVCCRTLGSSMFPLIRTGSLLQVQPLEMGQPRPGDVILFQSGEALVAHRLIRKEPRQGNPVLITRGDAFPWHAIERVAPDQVLGRVVSVEWRPGWTLRLDSGPGRLLGRLLAPISPFLLRACKLRKQWAEELGRFFSFSKLR
jgi:signal peptidase I